MSVRWFDFQNRNFLFNYYKELINDRTLTLWFY